MVENPAKTKNLPGPTGNLPLPQIPDNLSGRRSSRLSSNSKKNTPKIRKVNGYIIFYDEVIGRGQFGTVVKAQLASDLLSEEEKSQGGP